MRRAMLPSCTLATLATCVTLAAQLTAAAAGDCGSRLRRGQPPLGPQLDWRRLQQCLHQPGYELQHDPPTSLEEQCLHQCARCGLRLLVLQCVFQTRLLQPID